MESYIDVRGEAPLTESVVEYRAALSVAVRAAHDETALAESDDLRSRCIRALLEAGLGESDIAEGSGEIWRPWFWSRKPGQEVSRRILIACTDVNRLYRAVATLEPLFADKRRSVSVSMRAPRFDAAAASRAAAQVAAVADARSKAEIVATAANVVLGSVVQIEELDDQVRRSGAYGDEGWGAFAAAAGAPDQTPEPLEAATRTRTLRFRVRFALKAG